ncbi:MAG TPA: prepilin-type N-terminal cleavage/methylation domain-containing protein [Candidatus Saccharibacteria bacterium]|nr:prepilin-type N-terminal cleavage/methylation domain-containing protein [Candidatus Saccharibacteria bacterium]
MNKLEKKEKGFTIIEVVLVLAIGALIFLVVFLAVPALQRSQRDQQRRSDASRVSSAVTNYQSNNNGKLPDTTTAAVTSFTQSYLKNSSSTGNGTTGELKSPTTRTEYAIGIHSTLTLPAGITSVPAAGTVPAYNTEGINIIVGFKCNGETAVAATGRYAVLINLEGGGRYCVGS